MPHKLLKYVEIIVEIGGHVAHCVTEGMHASVASITAENRTGWQLFGGLLAREGHAGNTAEKVRLAD
jgi:hypothetical protein